MPVETRPQFKLGRRARDSQPLGSKSYWFKRGESFTTIAQQLKLDPKRLIKFNFGSTDPAEVNWYLREYIGYVRPTRDGKNWMFDPGQLGVTKGRKFIYVPLTFDERSAIVRHYHNLVMARMQQLIHDFGDPQPQMGHPAFVVDPGRHSDTEMQYLSAIVGFAEVIRVLIWPEDYYADTGRDYLEPPPELPAPRPKPGSEERRPRGKGYGKGFEAAITFWDQTIETPGEVQSEADLLHFRPSPALPSSLSAEKIRLRIADELSRTNARDLFDRMKKFIEDERRRFHGVNEPYVWGRP